MNSKVGRRVEVDSESMFVAFNGLQGLAIAEVETKAYPAVRVALDNGMVQDIPSICLKELDSDITAELTRPDLPAITTKEEQEDATIQAARVYEVMTRNRESILNIEAAIKREQDELAQRLRATYSELYESQRITAIVYSEHEARLQAGAEALWQAAGCPDKGKTYGAAQIADDWQCVTFDPVKALEFARTQIPALVSSHVDETKFKKAVKDGYLTNVPEDVCHWVKGYKIKTLTTVLEKSLPLPGLKSE